MDKRKQSGAPILNVYNVSKTFGGVVRALDEVSLEVHPNEIVGVVGENGAGKTTLMKILVGVYPPDKGEWAYRGVSVPFPKSPKEAARKGISIVYQEKGVVPSLKVYQFLFLGNEDRYVGKVGLQIDRIKAHAREILKEFHVQCDVDNFMHELPLSTQKMVEIAKAILSVRMEQDDDTTQSVIILDEPTAPLTIEERKDLLDEISRMKKNTSFIFVTHIMQEVMECMDRVVVLRDGKLVGHYNMATDQVTEEDLTKVIVGKDTLEHRHEVASRKGQTGGVVLSADRLTKQGSYYDITFDLHRGECVGVFGPAGSGKSELIRTIAGLDNFENGTLSIMKKEVKNREPAHVRLTRGVGYFSGDTGNELLHDWSIAKNISILNIAKVVGKIIRIIRFNVERRMAERIVRKLKIRTPDVNTPVSALSGGSKQKVTVGKWFEKSPEIMLLEDPTIGIDVGSREDIFETVLDMKSRGISMILVSDDVREYSTLCDRIMLMKQGKVQEIISAEQLKEVMEA
jgi:ribose transport system ATP-binding protein